MNTFAKDRGSSESALSDMLNGKRDWSKSAVDAVVDFFGLNRGIKAITSTAVGSLPT